MQSLLEEIEQRLRGLLQRLADGDDAPPAMVLRLEGLLEAAVLLEQSTPEALQQLIDATYTVINGESLEARIGPDWAQRYPFPPATGHRTAGTRLSHHKGLTILGAGKRNWALWAATTKIIGEIIRPGACAPRT